MSKAALLVFAVAALLAFAGATLVNDCNTGNPMKDTTSVQISDCEPLPCKLRKRHNATILQRFTPSDNIQSLQTSVHATILGLPLPFLGVDGTDACDKIVKTADNTKAGCPLKAGVDYTYSNSFPVLQIYPSVDLTVYWALTEQGKIITCFTVPAKIF